MATTSTYLIRKLRPDDADACDAIIASLPYHFGQEVGRTACAEAVRRDDGLVAVANDAVVGFLTVERHFSEAAEITWMAVQAEHRRRGIGHLLIEHLAAELEREARRLLLLFTVSPSDSGPEPDGGYQSTRAFYTKNGFVLARDFPGMWETDTPALFIRVLSPASASP